MGIRKTVLTEFSILLALSVVGCAQQGHSVLPNQSPSLSVSGRAGAGEARNGPVYLSPMELEHHKKGAPTAFQTLRPFGRHTPAPCLNVGSYYEVQCVMMAPGQTDVLPYYCDDCTANEAPLTWWNSTPPTGMTGSWNPDPSPCWQLYCYVYLTLTASSTMPYQSPGPAVGPDDIQTWFTDAFGRSFTDDVRVTIAPLCSISSVTAATTPSDTSRTTLGVAEIVSISSTDGDSWSVSGDGSLSSSTGTRVTFTAGQIAGTATVTVSGPSCVANTITFTVIMPQGIYYQRTGGIAHTQGQPIIGIEATIYLEPDSVSFKGIYQVESNDTGYATGVWACKNGGSASPAPAVVAGDDVSGYGSQLSKLDVINSGECPGYSSPFPASTEADTIVQKYAVSSKGPFYQFWLVNQLANLDGSGNLTIQKGVAPGLAAGATTVDSPNSRY